MRLLLTAIGIVLLTYVAAAADAPPIKADGGADGEKQLIRVERDWNEAMKRQDKAAISAICANDFRYTGEDGKVSNRAEYLTELSQHVRVVNYTLSDLTVKVYGDTGVLFGRFTGTVAVDGQEEPVSMRFTDTFVQRNKRWWAVASQGTHVGEQ